MRRNENTMSDFTIENSILQEYRGKNEHVFIPEGVTAIASDCFRGHRAVRLVELPSSLKYIGRSAFENCVSLRTVMGGKHVIEIGENAFSGCRNLKTIGFTKDLRRLHGGAFAYCSSLRELDLSAASVDDIARWSFAGCVKLRKVLLPPSLIRVDEYAFSGCTDMRKIELPEKLAYIGTCAFAECGMLKKVILPDSLKKIGDYAFKGCDLRRTSLPSGVILGYNAFRGCEQITFPEKMSVIDDRAFEGCSSLWDVEMPRSLYKLGSYAFDGCSPKSLAIPEDLEMLGVNFVDTDTPLDLINDSHGYELVENLDDVYNCRIFFHYLDSDFEISNGNLLSCRSKQRHITLPNNIESIKANAFKNCANLESLYIPDSVMLIGDYALSGCQRLSEVRLPESYFGLGERVFENCPSLKKLHIPKSLLYFKRNAFEGSGPFESITCDEDSLRFVMKDGKLVTKGFSYRDHQGPDFELSMLFEDFTLGGEVILAEKGAEEETK